MKKVVSAILVVCMLCGLTGCAVGTTAETESAEQSAADFETASAESYPGTWAEQTAERVILTIKESDEPDWYDAEITWREDLPQKDVYTMRAHYQEDGSLYYEDCTYVIRTFEEDGTYTDELQYENGSGLFSYSPSAELLYWTDYTLDPSENVQTFIRADDLAPETSDAADASSASK